MRIYRSTFNTGIAAFIIGMITITLIIMIIVKAWLGITIDVLALAFVIHMFSTTYYTVQGNTLRIKCGFLYNLSVDISSIKNISETNNPISSPATSLNRLEIVYNHRDTVLISPKEKLEFINHLKEMNSGLK